MPRDLLKPIRPGLVAMLLALPAAAQDQPPVPGEALGDRMGQLFSDLMAEVDPWMADLLDKLGDLTGWHAPEVLPNGDILIRRRLPPDQPPDQPSDSESGSGSGEPFEL